MNTELRTKAKNYFEKSFFKVMSNSKFKNNMENVRKRRDIRLVCKRRKNELPSVRNKLLHKKMISKKPCGNRNDKKRSKNKQARVFRSVNSEHQQDSDL